jgi:hypothetical protein
MNTIGLLFSALLNCKSVPAPENNGRLRTRLVFCPDHWLCPIGELECIPRSCPCTALAIRLYEEISLRTLSVVRFPSLQVALRFSSLLLIGFLDIRWQGNTIRTSTERRIRCLVGLVQAHFTCLFMYFLVGIV